ncbi:hypothetical protein [Streptomyces sp. WMMB303]|uniref:hypothetical protein n=1 Tax=unclassified Streptomyces TaxID=2593676 RepID=UPI0023EA7BAE|nr:hypothetical protein [Streptomyces sp. WMMB303]MDF4254516.1 hypothetical protein [Streptomyces sp. WMMB303]
MTNRPANTAPPDSDYWLRFGTRVLDRAANAEGQVTGIGEPFEHCTEAPSVAYVRPLHGGVEWKAAVKDLSPVDETGGCR